MITHTQLDPATWVRYNVKSQVIWDYSPVDKDWSLGWRRVFLTLMILEMKVEETEVAEVTVFLLFQHLVNKPWKYVKFCHNPSPKSKVYRTWSDSSLPCHPPTHFGHCVLSHLIHLLHLHLQVQMYNSHRCSSSLYWLRWWLLLQMCNSRCCRSHTHSSLLKCWKYISLISLSSLLDCFYCTIVILS